MPGGQRKQEATFKAWLVVGMKGQALAPELSSSLECFPYQGPAPKVSDLTLSSLPPSSCILRFLLRVNTPLIEGKSLGSTNIAFLPT